MLDQIVIDLSKYRLEKAYDLLGQAEILFENQKYDGSINRSYYAIFNAMRSLLALLKLDSSSHAGVLSFYDRYFVKTNIFDKKFSKMAHSAFDSRQDSDYEDFYQPTKEDAEQQLQQAQSFISEIKLKREQLINQKINFPIIQN
ncbi:MAG: HEPN domain-containing protein [bacterium]|jgi:uncharacterized protein (UPF0332 family)|nr:HEPN domain-containing protein [bacterium]